MIRLFGLLVMFALIPEQLLGCDCANATVLWVDTADRRYYVSLDETTELTVRAKVYDLVAQIQAEHPAWRGAIRISFLSSGALAEPHTPNASEYIAEFDQAKSQLTWRPASANPRRSELFVFIPSEP